MTIIQLLALALVVILAGWLAVLINWLIGLLAWRMAGGGKVMRFITGKAFIEVERDDKSKRGDVWTI